jgi:hypothetical protein
MKSMSDSEALNSGFRVPEQVYVCNATNIRLNFLQKSKFPGLLICPFLYSVIFHVQKNGPMRPPSVPSQDSICCM